MNRESNAVKSRPTDGINHRKRYWKIWRSEQSFDGYQPTQSVAKENLGLTRHNDSLPTTFPCVRGDATVDVIDTTPLTLEEVAIHLECLVRQQVATNRRRCQAKVISTDLREPYIVPAQIVRIRLVDHISRA